MPTCLGSTNIIGTLTVSGELDAYALALHMRNLLMPVGTIITYAANSAPAGFLICDGSAVSRSTYADLFAIIGTNFGIGDGTSTFNIPNLNGKFVMGCDVSHAYNTTGGHTSMTLNAAQMPAHRHTISISDPGHTHTITDPGHTHGLTDPTHTHGYQDTVWSENQGHGTGQVGTSSSTDWDNDSYFVSRTTAAASTGISVNSNSTGVTMATTATGVTATASITGSGDIIDITNPYVALYYIIRY